MPRLRFLVAVLAFVALLLASCGRVAIDVERIPELPEADQTSIEELLARSDRPVVLNVWASWCIPCRSEAPLLDAAAQVFGDDVRFVGLNVRDNQLDAREFIAEFLAESPIEHFSDRSGGVPPAMGGNTGVPLTFFFAAGGELAHLHTGVIDERGLAFYIDELLAGTS